MVEEPSVEEEQNGVADEAVNGGGVESETATSDASEDSFDDGSDLDDLDKLEADDGSD